ncbi:MAG: heavy metal-responsive transcriptional regulator [Candidatus Sericytochromatia bacterium]
MENNLLIKELAQKLDITTKTIRFYEDEGVIPKAKRADNNYRYYTEDDYKRLKFIKKARALGMSIEEIKKIFEIREKGNMPCCTVVSMLERHLIETEKKIQELTEFKNNLSNTIDKFKNNMNVGEKGEVCGLIEDLFE